MHKEIVLYVDTIFVIRDTIIAIFNIFNLLLDSITICKRTVVLYMLLIGIIMETIYENISEDMYATLTYDLILFII